MIVRGIIRTRVFFELQADFALLRGSEAAFFGAPLFLAPTVIEV
jgi:hypothetical protein